MKKTIIIVIVIILSFSVVFASTGCAQRLAERAIESAIENAAAQEGEDVDIDFSEGELNISDEEGNEMSFGGADIPEDWPSVVPINNDIEINFSASQTTDGKKGWSITGTYGGRAEELYNYYKGEFSGWDEVSDVKTDMGDDGMNYSYQATNGTYLASFFANESDEGVNVVLSVVEE